MPIYCYKCDDCDYIWDEFRSLGDHATRCPECDGAGRHVFEPVRFKFVLGGPRPRRRRESEGKVYSRTYGAGETVGDPMLDGGFRRVKDDA